MQRIKRDYYKPLYANSIENLEVDNLENNRQIPRNVTSPKTELGRNKKI